MILTALKTFQESKAVNPAFTVSLRDLQWVNIKFVIEEMSIGLYIKNTLIVAVISTAGTVVMTVLSAFAFSKIDFKGRETLFSLLLMTMMIPGEIYMITNFLTVSRQGFGWVGTGVDNSVGYFATMIIPAMVSVFYIFFLRQTFKQVPDSLYKAAKVDGCSDFKYLRRVMIPIAGPTIFTITILNILGSWSAFIWPRLITSLEPTIGQNYWLISVALRENSFVIDKGGGMTETMFNLQIAATAIVTVPLVIVFLLLRKYIMTGVGRSGTKG
jgi:ABC-type glycerol-3-phosphate transport system permease component